MELPLRHLDIGFDWILRDRDHFKKIKYPDQGFGHYILEREDIDQKFISWLEDRKLDIKMAEIFCVPPGRQVPVHSDEIDTPGACKLNWGYGDQGVSIDWYEKYQGAEIKKEWNTIGGYYLTCDEEYLDLVWTKKLGTPSLVNIGEMHGAVNSSDEDWWIVCVVLKELGSDEHRLDWMNILKILGEYERAV